jgi:predicted secreted Zn-dependent protease
MRDESMPASSHVITSRTYIFLYFSVSGQMHPPIQRCVYKRGPQIQDTISRAIGREIRMLADAPNHGENSHEWEHFIVLHDTISLDQRYVFHIPRVRKERHIASLPDC